MKFINWVSHSFNLKVMGLSPLLGANVTVMFSGQNAAVQDVHEVQERERDYNKPSWWCNSFIAEYIF